MATSESQIMKTALVKELVDRIADGMLEQRESTLDLEDAARRNRAHFKGELRLDPTDPSQANPMGLPEAVARARAPKPRPKPTDPDDGEEAEPEVEEEEEEEEDPTEVQDINDQAADMLECGVEIPEPEVFVTNLAMKELTKRFPLAKAWWWGKITGLKYDYMVIKGQWDMERVEAEEAEKETEEEEEEPKERDPIAYFVTTTKDWGIWQPLPDLKPLCLEVSRSFKRYFTGDLQAAVQSHPPFPGVEADLLRVQIERIERSSTKATLPPVPPKPRSEDDEEEEDPEDLEEEDEEGKKPEVHPEDQEEGETAWSLRDMGDAKFMAKSLLWTGSVISYQIKNYALTSRKIYCGTGVKESPTTVYMPPLPPTVCSEYSRPTPLQVDATRDKVEPPREAEPTEEEEEED